jgi:hypothetical protein
VARELDLLGSGQFKNLLEATSDRQENLLTLLPAASLTTSNIAFASARNALSYGASPDADTEEGLADVDNNTHDFAIVLVLKSLANSAHHNLEPETVDVDVALVLVLVRPLATMFVLGVLPLGANTFLEKVVVGLEREFGDGGNVVIDAPKLFNRVKGDDFLEEVVPVVALSARGLGEPKSPLVLERVLDVEVVLVVENSDGLVVLDVGRLFLASGVDGDGGEVDLLIHLGGFCCGGSHRVWCFLVRARWRMKGFADERSRGRFRGMIAEANAKASDAEVGRGGRIVRTIPSFC